MPKGKTQKKKKMKKRAFNPAKPSRPQTWNLWNSAGSIVPDKVRVRLPFSTTINFTNIADSYAENIFRMNSCYDPDLTGIGNQPRGFDQWSGFYNRYRVVCSTINVKAMPQFESGSGGNTASARVVVFPSTNQAGVSDIDAALEQPYRKSFNTGFYQGGEKDEYVKTRMPVAQFAGVKESAIYDSQVYSAFVSTNPATEFYWVVGVSNESGTSSLSLDVNITITYYVEFFDRLQLSGS